MIGSIASSARMSSQRSPGQPFECPSTDAGNCVVVGAEVLGRADVDVADDLAPFAVELRDRRRRSFSKPSMSYAATGTPVFTAPCSCQYQVSLDGGVHHAACARAAEPRRSIAPHSNAAAASAKTAAQISAL